MAMVQDSIYWLNAFPSDNLVSDTLVLDEIVQVLTHPNYDKITIDFGSYAQLHTDTDNNTRSIMIGDISL